MIIPGGNLGNVYAFYKGFKMARDLGLVRERQKIPAAAFCFTHATWQTQTMVFQCEKE